MDDARTIEFWLPVMAVAMVIQTAIIAAAIVIAARAYRRSAVALEVFRRNELAPFVARVHDALDEVHVAVERVKAADGDVRQVINQASATTLEAVSAVRFRALPVLVLARGVLAALSVVKRRLAPGVGTGRGPSLATFQGGRTHVRK